MRTGRPYTLGTKVQGKTGYVRIKVGSSNWLTESRYNWIMQRGELKEGDKVFHLDGDRTNNRITNLVKIRTNTKKFVMLGESRVLFTPKRPVVIPEVIRKVYTLKEKELVHA